MDVQQQTLLGGFPAPKQGDTRGDEPVSADRVRYAADTAAAGKQDLLQARLGGPATDDSSSFLPVVHTTGVPAAEAPAGNSRRQSLSDLTERPSGLANVMSAECLSASMSLEARDASASGSDNGPYPDRAEGVGVGGREQSAEGSRSVDGTVDDGKGQRVRRVSPSSSHCHPPSPPKPSTRTILHGSQGLKV